MIICFSLALLTKFSTCNMDCPHKKFDFTLLNIESHVECDYKTTTTGCLNTAAIEILTYTEPGRKTETLFTSFIDWWNLEKKKSQPSTSLTKKRVIFPKKWAPVENDNIYVVFYIRVRGPYRLAEAAERTFKIQMKSDTPEPITIEFPTCDPTLVNWCPLTAVVKMAIIPDCPHLVAATP